MKEIKIKSLGLENFKCHRRLNIDFNGDNVSIYGDNATGKTTIYDALMWVLFSKDSHGNGEKNFEVKPLNEYGEVADHNALTSVTAVLLVDGVEVELKRTLREIWSTKRGHAEATYDGNTSEYFINGVPVKRFAFVDAVEDMVSEDTFRMLTSISHFADGISWQDRRAVLFDCAGTLDDATIMATDERFVPLATAMGVLSLADYKRKLQAEKKTYAQDKVEIPARISECEKTIEDVEALDFSAYRAEMTALTGKKDRIEADIIALQHNTAADEKRLQIKEAQLERKQIEESNRLFRNSQTSGTTDISALRRELDRYQREKKTKEVSLSTRKKALADLDKRIDEHRDRWIAVNAETFTGDICQSCGQTLPAERVQAARDIFAAKKRERLNDIENAANALKKTRKDTEASISTLEDEVALTQTCIEAKEAEIAKAEESRVDPVDMEGYAEAVKVADDKIAALNVELTDLLMDTADSRSELERQLVAVKREINTCAEMIGKESLLTYSRERVEKLRETARISAEALDRIEGMLILIDDFTRYKTGFVEDSINSLFRIARFRLFREQANGGIEDRCDVVLDGVPYIGLNNGAKINVGIDIINTLSRVYGVRVPLFIDNAESVTHLEQSDSQIIRLVVSENDKEVRVEHEN